LNVNHKKLDGYIIAKEVVIECYNVTRSFPDSEKFSMVSQIRRAALSVLLNIAEGASRKSEIGRKRFYEISRGSLIEIDAAFDIAKLLGYLENYDTSPLADSIVRCFKMTSKLINPKVISNHD
jgi:four helix bundle protein